MGKKGEGNLNNFVLTNGIFMGWRLVISYCMAAVLVITPVVAFSGEPDEILEMKCLRPVVKVEQDRSYGTGTIVRSGRIDDNTWVNVVFTCAHVVQGMTAPNIGVPHYCDWSKIDPTKNEIHPGLVYCESQGEDLAIMLFFSNRQMPTADIGCDERLYIGNDVMRTGCANGDYPRMEFGKVTGVTNKLLRTTMPAMPGDSGGPVWHRNKMVAITQRIAVARIGGLPFPVFTDSKNVRLAVLKEWQKSEKKAAVCEATTALPRWPILLLQVKQFKPQTASAPNDILAPNSNH